MKVDVIIPAHNPGPYLREAIDSCLAQTYKNFQIYVIDDASTDNIKNLVSVYKDVVYLRLDKNSGPSKARNFGISHGDGELISFLDADDLWEPRKLEWSVDEFKSNPNVALTCGNYQRLVNRRKLCNPFYRRPIVINHKVLIRQNFIASGSVTIRRDVFEEIGGFDESLWIGEDYKMWLLCAERHKIKYIHKVLYKYSVIPSGSSLMHRDDLQKSHSGRLDAFKIESMERVNAAKTEA